MTLGGPTFYQAKSPIFVFKDASTLTRITLLEPANARLYYTDWATWNTLGSSDDSAQARDIAAGSSAVVSVPQCGKDAWGVPGMLILDGPTCLTFQVTGQDPDWEETRTVPFYTERCEINRPIR